MPYKPGTSSGPSLYERTRLNSTQRGYGSKRWQRDSKAFLRENPLCRDPYGAHKPTAVLASETDHIIPHRGNQKLFWDRSNWQPLCKACHSRKTSTEDRLPRKG